MGGSKPTFTPYPSFHQNTPSKEHIFAVGRCRINPLTCTESTDEFNAIIGKNVEQSKVELSPASTLGAGEQENNNNNNNSNNNNNMTTAMNTAENKKLKKKYMKQGVAMAQSYLYNTLKVDASVIDIEMVLDAATIVESDGCIAACFLDAGCDQIVVTANDNVSANGNDNGSGSGDSLLHQIGEAIHVSGIPKERIMIHLDYATVKTMLEESPGDIAQMASWTKSMSVYFSSTEACTDVCTSFMTSLAEAASTPVSTPASASGPDIVVTAPSMRIVIQVPCTEQICSGEFVSSISKYCHRDETPRGTVSLIDPSPTQMGMSYASCIRTDRPDGLYTTVVCTRSNEALGLVYSSAESIVAALECGRGVYYSRSRNGLWRKGDTSGHYQTLHRIDVDCDGDALRFTVTQRGGDSGGAFCHLGTLTCWGEPAGVRRLEGTLRSRLRDAPAGSYTKRLFDDGDLLRDKLVEEAQELSEADTAQHVAEELADVLYFAMVKAAKAGVSIDDAVAELDKKSRKVTRRKGDSKAFRIEAGNAILGKK